MLKRKSKEIAPPRYDLYVSLSLLALTLMVYFQVHTFDFVNFDDRETIIGNSHIRDGITLAGLAWAFTSAYAANWFPVTWISHMLDFQLFGLDSGWHHLTNLMIHLASTALLFVMLKRMTQKLGESAFVSFVFALHPLHVESVAWVTERKDVLSAFFWILTIWLYLDYVDQPGPRRYLLALAAFCLGLMSKQMLVTLPFALLLLDYWPLMRPKTARLLIEKIPYVVLSAAVSLVTYKVQRAAGAVTALDFIPLATRAENAVISYVAYIVQFFWPSGLAVFYPYPPVLPVWQIAGSALILGAISALALLRPYLAVGWFWYLGTLVPVIGLVQVGLQAKADRYTYIPTIGLSIMLAWGVSEIVARWPRAKFPVQAAAVSICLAWLALTWTQVQYWQNSVTLFDHAIASTHDNFIAHSNLGVVLAEQGKTQDALRHLFASVEENPNHGDARNNLGALLGRLGRTDEAAEQFAQAIRISPNDAHAHNNLGNTLVARQKFAEGANEFQTALRLLPDFALAHFGLGGALLNLGHSDEAIAQFSEALRLDPNLAPARDGLKKALSLKQAPR
ncbi:MAG TPA: tetratricopeptide repeat protein [Bryobacteraceae bacterium]|nr:tetratricopeptide repeat protein [Bryobacteraceae bacterium]